MTNEVKQPAATQTFTAATDSASNAAGVTNLCGVFAYSITESYPFITIDQSTPALTLQSNDMTKIGSHTVTLSAALTNYPARPAVTKTFTAVLVDPCLTTVLTLPTSLANFTIDPLSDVPIMQNFMPATDSKADSTAVASLCGPRVYSIVETKPASFSNILPPVAGQELTSAWTLSELSNSCTDVGVWKMTLQASLVNYPMVAAATKDTTVTVYNKCCNTPFDWSASTLTNLIAIDDKPKIVTG